MKRILSVILAVLMMLTAAGTALAGEGDRTVLLANGDDGYYTNSIQNLMTDGQKVWIVLSGYSQKLVTYDIGTGESAEFDMQGMLDELSGGDGSEAEESDQLAFGSIACYFPWNGELYAVMCRTVHQDETSSMDGGHVRKVIPADGKTSLADEDAVTLDWSGMTQTEGSQERSKYIGTSASAGNKLYLTGHDNDGNENLYLFDLENGEAEEYEIQEIDDFTLTPDGKMIVMRTVWGENAESVYGYYDPASESMEEIVRFDLNAGQIGGFCYDEGTGTVYYIRQGEIFAAPKDDLSQEQAVNDAPTGGGRFSALTGNGQILIWDYSGAFLRNLDPALRSQVSIRVRSYSWSEAMKNAGYTFPNEHSDISLILEEPYDESTLLQGMMNRDSSVDAYIMDISSSAYNAVYDREFMADLGGSAKLKAATEAMYPFARDAAQKNGTLVAFPLRLRGSGLGYRPEVMEKLGLTEADMPKTWEQFLDFLPEAASRIQGTDCRVFDFYSSRESVQSQIVEQILTQYSLVYEDAPMNSDLLRGLLDKIQKLDYEAAGILTDEELERVYEEDGFSSEDLMKEPLFSAYANYGMGDDYSQPLALAFEEGTEPILPVELTVAFINPYSEHPQEAMLFLESMLDHMDTINRYSFDPSQNEPVRYPNHEEMRQSMQRWLDEAKRNQKIADGAGTVDWEQIVAEYEKMLAEFDETNWMIGPKNIQYYRARAERLMPMRWVFYRALGASEGGEEYWTLLQGYQEGTVAAGELLSFIDRKIQMMRLEGN